MGAGPSDEAAASACWPPCLCAARRKPPGNAGPDPAADRLGRLLRVAVVPLGCAVAGGVGLRTGWAGGAALPTPARWGLAGLAAGLPLVVAVDAALPVVQRKIQEAEEEEQRPLPDGVHPSSIWYRCTVVLRVCRWAEPDWALWGGAYGLLVADALATGAMPSATAACLAAIVAPDADVLQPMAAATGLMLVAAVAKALEGVVMEEAKARLVRRVQRRALAAYMAQDTPFLDSLGPAAVMENLGNVGQLRTILVEFLPGLLRLGLQLSSTVFWLAQYDRNLATVCLLAVPLEYAFGQWQAERMRAGMVKLDEWKVERQRIAAEMVLGAKPLRTHHAAAAQLGDFSHAADGFVAELMVQQWQKAGLAVLGTALPHFVTLVVFGYAAHLTRHNTLPVTQLMVVTLQQGQLMALFSKALGVYDKFGRTMQQCALGLRFLGRPPQHVPRGVRRPDADWVGSISLEHVSFRYSAEGPFVLRDVSLTVRAGECVALAGPSGGGKSSVLHLMAALYDPTEGQVLVDGVPAAEYAPDWYFGRGAAMVPQMPALVHGTVRENIAFGLADQLTDEEVEQAATLANAAEFIAALPEGYDTNVGRGGERLSGGQRQRVALARALVRRPGILLLDEATSALDAEAEAGVQQAVQRAMHGRTVVLAAHRLSSLRHATRIVVIDQGRVVEDGEFAALLAANGAFARLVQSQLQPEATVATASPSA